MSTFGRLGCIGFMNPTLPSTSCRSFFCMPMYHKLGRGDFVCVTCSKHIQPCLLHVAVLSIVICTSASRSLGCWPWDAGRLPSSLCWCRQQTLPSLLHHACWADARGFLAASLVSSCPMPPLASRYWQRSYWQCNCIGNHGSLVALIVLGVHY